MKYVDEYRSAEEARTLSRMIHAITTQPWKIMEVCGGQTHAIVRFGIDQLLPESITLLHGPGCPVCVTPLEIIDKAVEIAARPEVTFCSFGDMLRVPGSNSDLFAVKARGGDVRVVYSPLDAVKIASAHPERQVVFFAVGFETTAPANAMAVLQAKERGLQNFSLLVSHVLIPPALEALLSSPNRQMDGFLAAGHVCAIMGIDEYQPIAAKYRVPIVITGFEPLDILQGAYQCIQQLETGRAVVENAYGRAVRDSGNIPARRTLRQIFEVVPRKWRGIGSIPRSGLTLTQAYREFDAEARFGVAHVEREEASECISGLILQGLRKPYKCPAFSIRCTPEAPLGATMVSSEGACAAYFRYRGRSERCEPKTSQ